MGFSAKVLAASINEAGIPLTTLEVTFPRIILAEFNTHRMLSRNSASSRAIPVEKMIARVMEDPFIPASWPVNRRGMQATEVITDQAEIDQAVGEWLNARDSAVKHARTLLDLGIHKQITNRLLEPWLWHTVIVTATHWDNFFALRMHKDAQPEFRIAATAMAAAMQQTADSDRGLLRIGEWHLPLFFPDDWVLLSDVMPGDHPPQLLAARISCARCARVSYLTHDGKRDLAEDLRLADRLQRSGHMSPFEHAAVAEAGYQNRNVGNFHPSWRQYRKLIPGEAVFQPPAE